ncbi:hypothetical protein IE53DRAFT_385896 [Violaceomyces palustris]|uniref:Uncharacterized protein n=1 Tax=Violaceomyces palustris TaxID=1673888 RepID=A0ACD0P0R7_9BASI|nr:hypothetical protein IE53DRAFT_385896 [Violaceomyces palustris]
MGIHGIHSNKEHDHIKVELVKRQQMNSVSDGPKEVAKYHWLLLGASPGDERVIGQSRQGLKAYGCRSNTECEVFVWLRGVQSREPLHGNSFQETERQLTHVNKVLIIRGVRMALRRSSSSVGERVLHSNQS